MKLKFTIIATFMYQCITCSYIHSQISLENFIKNSDAALIIKPAPVNFKNLNNRYINNNETTLISELSEFINQNRLEKQNLFIKTEDFSKNNITGRGIYNKILNPYYDTSKTTAPNIITKFYSIKFYEVFDVANFTGKSIPFIHSSPKVIALRLYTPFEHQISIGQVSFPEETLKLESDRFPVPIYYSGIGLPDNFSSLRYYQTRQKAFNYDNINNAHVLFIKIKSDKEHLETIYKSYLTVPHTFLKNELLPSLDNEPNNPPKVYEKDYWSNVLSNHQDHVSFLNSIGLDHDNIPSISCINTNEKLTYYQYMNLTRNNGHLNFEAKKMPLESPISYHGIFPYNTSNITSIVGIKQKEQLPVGFHVFYNRNLHYKFCWHIYKNSLEQQEKQNIWDYIKSHKSGKQLQ